MVDHTSTMENKPPKAGATPDLGKAHAQTSIPTTAPDLVAVSTLPSDPASQRVVTASPDPQQTSLVPAHSLSVAAPPLLEESADSSSAPPKCSEEALSSPLPLLWAARLKSSLRNLKKCAEPEFLDDGTPVVIAPDSVILESSQTWKNYLIAHFVSTPPSAAKIYADLNPIWGRFGDILVRQFSNESCLILIPSETTRKWVLDVGYWQAGNCAFTVSEWTPSANLHSQKLTSIPLWVVLRNIPPQLYSLDGISVFASAIGEPMHTEKSRLNPIQVGEAKIKVEIRLKSKLPPFVVVRDARGNSVKITASYPRVPPNCTFCDEFGHLVSSCSKAPKGFNKKRKKKEQVQNSAGGCKETVVVAEGEAIAEEVVVGAKTVAEATTEATPIVEARAEIPRASLSPVVLAGSSVGAVITPKVNHLDLVTETRTSKSKKQSKKLEVIREETEPSNSITSSQYEDIAVVLAASQKYLDIPSSASKVPYKDLSPKAKKRARKKQRQAMMAAHLLAEKKQQNQLVDNSVTSARRDLPQGDGSSSSQ